MTDHAPKRQPRRSRRGEARPCRHGAEVAPVLERSSPGPGAGVPHTALSLAVQYAIEAPELPRWRLRRWVGRTLAALPDAPPAACLTLRLVDADEGLALNRDYRGRDAATNVLTFEYGADPDGTVSGDIVLCLPVLRREAAEQGKPLLWHAAHLVVHGVLHALGHDHIDPDEAERMEALETAILADMGVDDPYRNPDAA